jgi:hypothetical protein
MNISIKNVVKLENTVVEANQFLQESIERTKRNPSDKDMENLSELMKATAELVRTYSEI